MPHIQVTDTIRQRWGLLDATLGLLTAIAAVTLVGLAISRGVLAQGAGTSTLSYVASWGPLLGAVLLATYARGQRSLRLDFGLRFTWLDILFGLALGFFLRSVTTVIEIVIYGSPAGGAITFGHTIYDVWWVLIAVAAPVLISPLIEELFFRGLLQRAVLKATGRSMAAPSRLPTVIAVAVSSFVFATVHVLQTSGGTETAAVLVSTLVLGIGLGTLAAVTGRLGGAIIAHIAFNGLGVLGTLL